MMQLTSRGWWTLSSQCTSECVSVELADTTKVRLQELLGDPLTVGSVFYGFASLDEAHAAWGAAGLANVPFFCRD